METKRDTNLLFNWIFIGNLSLLALNDHIFKWSFSNFLTGKISDFSGLLIFPLFVQFLVPRLKPLITVTFCGLLFIFWKLPLSDNFIYLYNKFALIPIVRTVDYSDLIALFILPVSYLVINKTGHFALFKEKRSINLNPSYLFIASCLVFMATSPPLSYYMQPGGDIHIGKSYKIKVGKEVILKRLAEEGFTIKPDSSANPIGGATYYLVENIALNQSLNKVKSIQIGFKGSFLLVNNIYLKENLKMSDWKALKEFTKHYRTLIESEIINEVK